MLASSRPGRATVVRCAVASWVLLVATGCGDDTGGGSLEPTYDNVEMVVQRSCAFGSSCHGGLRNGSAQLNFQALIDEGRPITEALVEVPACEYDAMPRIDPGDPDNSWLWMKLNAEHDAGGNIQFEPDPSWDHGLERDEDGNYPTSECPLVVAGEIDFGVIMPRNAANPMPLPDEELRMFRDWIAMGAPGPERPDDG